MIQVEGMKKGRWACNNISRISKKDLSIKLVTEWF